MDNNKHIIQSQLLLHLGETFVYLLLVMNFKTEL